ncbi:MAG: DUF2905 domain-containing protein [Dehalococcoidales bacterium]
MFGLENLGKFLILVGVFIAILGLVLVLANKVPFVGRLPGDIFIQKGNFQFHFPIVTGLVISLVLTIIVNIIIRLFGR